MAVENHSDAELVASYLQWLGVGCGRSPRTLETYGLALRRLLEYLGGKPLAEVELPDLEGFSGLWLHKRGVVARSRKPYVSAVRGFFAWLAKRGHMRRDAAAALRHPSVSRPLPNALSLASAEKLMWAPDLGTFQGIRDAAIMALLVGCGVRVSGLTALNEGDLRNADVDGQVRLVVHVTEKGAKERVLPVPREAEMLLRVYLDHDELRRFDRTVTGRNGPDKVLFVNGTNTRVSPADYHGEATRMGRLSVWRLIQRYGRRVGVPEHELHPHAFRHLFGTELAEDDVPLDARQDLLGHSDPKSTAIYTAMSVRRKVRLMDKSSPLSKFRSPVSDVLKRLRAAP